jgi:hypothetical protein
MDTNIKIMIDTEEIDKTIEKTKELIILLKEVRELLDSLRKS